MLISEQNIRSVPNAFYSRNGCCTTHAMYSQTKFGQSKDHYVLHFVSYCLDIRDSTLTISWSVHCSSIRLDSPSRISYALKKHNLVC